jgi:beta-glucanase (GH16 family)
MNTLIAVLATSVAAALLATSAHAAGWELAWSDEFDREGLPDKAKWDYEEGFVRNNEAQFYTRARRENARVEAGCLVIECRKERFKLPKPAQGRDFADYTAASLITRRKADWTFGRIEVRAKIPQGKGVWPAVWTLGADISEVRWPACGEIDIMEFVGHDPNHVHGTVHWGGRGSKHESSGGKLEAEKPFADFHVYAIEWRADRIDFFFDDTKYHTFPVDKAGAGPDNPFRKAHYLIINFALGGSWGGAIDDANLPQKFLVDYVRVYREKTGGRAAPEK